MRAIDADAADMLDQRQRAAPAQPDAVDADLAAPARHDRESRPAPRPDRQARGDDLGRLDLAALLGQQIETGRAPPCGAAAMVTVTAPRSPI